MPPGYDALTAPFVSKQTNQVARRQEQISKCVNKEFAEWIHEWYLEALQKENRTMFIYKKALDSVIACEAVLRNGREAIKLPGIGEYIASRLDKKILEFVRSGGHWPHLQATAPDVQETVVYTSKSKKTVVRAYTPAFRSVAFAILLVLYEQRDQELVLRDTLVQMGQQYCATPLDSASISSSLTTLAGKGLVEKHPGGVSLTPEGKELARKLAKTINQSVPPSSEANVANEEEECSQPGRVTTSMWEAGSYDIQVMLDLREVKARDERDFFMDKLSDAALTVSQEHLPLGDFLWVAVHKRTHQRVVLDTIIERKTDSDFCQSIPDGRFKEQKHRLGACGVKRVIYLLEDHGCATKVASLGVEKVFAALIQTQVVDNFYLLITRSMEETVRLVAKLDHDIKRRYRGVDLTFVAPSPNCHLQQIKDALGYLHYQGISWHAFCMVNAKSANMTFRDLFTRQLMAVKGISREKAVALASKYGSLTRMIVCLSDANGLKELAEMVVGQRKMGNVLAQRVHNLLFLSSYPLDNK